MINKLLVVFAVALLAVAGSACSNADNANVSANQNTNASMASTTRPGSDDSVITTTTDAAGVKTETRTFRSNRRVSKVVVTTAADGRRTVRAYSPSGTEKVVDNVANALDETGDAIANAAGWTADKAKDALSEAGDKLEDAKDKTVSGAKEVGDKLEDVGDKTASGAKKVGTKTVEGAKKAGSAIKKAVTP
ncbi:MAG: hypothetical protein ACR2HX_12635 [Pyrinomonadaceae bacterium]